jgi:hypothetical protein
MALGVFLISLGGRISKSTQSIFWKFFILWVLRRKPQVKPNNKKGEYNHQKDMTILVNVQIYESGIESIDQISILIIILEIEKN